MFRKWVSVLLCLALSLCMPCAVAQEQEVQLKGITLSIPGNYTFVDQSDTSVMAHKDNDFLIIATGDDEEIFSILAQIGLSKADLLSMMKDEANQAFMLGDKPVCVFGVSDEDDVEMAAFGAVQLDTELLICFLLSKDKPGTDIRMIMGSVSDGNAGKAGQSGTGLGNLKEEYVPAPNADDGDWMSLVEKEKDGFHFCGVPWDATPDEALSAIATQSNRTMEQYKGNANVYLGVGNKSDLMICTVVFEESAGGAVTWSADCQAVPQGMGNEGLRVEKAYPWFAEQAQRAVKKWGEPTTCRVNVFDRNGSELNYADCTVDEMLDVWQNITDGNAKPEYLYGGIITYDNFQMSIEQLYSTEGDFVSTQLWFKVVQP